MTLEAESVFEAADKAAAPWALFWWFDPDACVVVDTGEKKWAVTLERLRRWRQERQESKRIDG